MCARARSGERQPARKPTVREPLEHIRLAIEGGVEIVNVYGPPGWHAFGPRTRNTRAS